MHLRIGHALSIIDEDDSQTAEKLDICKRNWQPLAVGCLLLTTPRHQATPQQQAAPLRSKSPPAAFLFLDDTV
jgi:hypothetical protein